MGMAHTLTQTGVASDFWKQIFPCLLLLYTQACDAGLKFTGGMNRSFPCFVCVNLLGGFFFLPLKHSRGLHRQSDIYTAYRSKLHQLSLSFYHFEVGTLQCGVGIRISLGHLTLTKPMCRCTGTLCVVYGDNL